LKRSTFFLKSSLNSGDASNVSKVFNFPSSPNLRSLSEILAYDSPSGYPNNLISSSSLRKYGLSLLKVS